MTVPRPTSEMAQHLVSKDPLAIAELTERHRGQLEEAFSELASVVPGCQSTLEELLPSMCRAIGRGYARSSDQQSVSLDAYVNSLSLPDLMLASACLIHDGAALQHLCGVIQNQIANTLRRSFATRVSRGLVEEAVDQLSGHCFEETTKGEVEGMPRLSSFLGRSSMSTWLYATAVRILLTALRQQTSFRGVCHALGIATVAYSDDQPSINVALDESHKQGVELRSELVHCLQETLDRMPAKRRLAAILRWVYQLRPAQIAERMRVSRPRISELLSEAREQFRENSRECLEQIAKESSRNLNEIEELLINQLDGLLVDSLHRNQREES